MIGCGVMLGADCRIGPHVSISHAVLGARVYVYPGARIGQEGFGFTMTPHGFQTVPQLGCVIIEDDVEVGANATIDRGALSDTVIGAGTRLDNQVQIGRHCAIAALVGISGSAKIGDCVVVGGQAGFTERVRIGSHARVGAQSGVMSDIEPDTVVVASPARPAREVFREIAVLKRLARPARS